MTMKNATNNDIHEIEVHLHAETERGLLVSVTGKRDDAEWVPKSQVEIERVRHMTWKLTAPEWLLHEKGLI